MEKTFLPKMLSVFNFSFTSRNPSFNGKDISTFDTKKEAFFHAQVAILLLMEKTFLQI